MNEHGYGSSYGFSEEHRPVTWFRGYPVYATHLFAAVLALSMVVTGLMQRTSAGFFVKLPFATPAIFEGEVWRYLTYGFLNAPSISFVIDLVFLVWFGREVERHLGRRLFFWLYGGLYFIGPVVLTAIGLIAPMGLAGFTGALAVFTAFATLYPNVGLMFNILAKWAAIILIAAFSVIHFSYRAESQLFALWATTGYAYLFIRYHQGRFSLPRFPVFRRKPNLRVLPDLPKKTEPPSASPTRASMAEVDALLDKIATSGIASLTPQERAKLDAARAELQRRSGRT